MDGCTRPDPGLGRHLVLRHGPGQTRGQGGTREPLGLARLRGARGHPRRGAVSPRPPAHPREGPPKTPLSLSWARGRRHPSCCGRVTRPGSLRPGGKDGSCRCSPQLLRVGISTGGGEQGEAPRAPSGGWGGRPAWEPASSPPASPHRIPMPAGPTFPVRLPPQHGWCLGPPSSC